MSYLGIVRVRFGTESRIQSTLAMSFLRFVDPSEGEIIIDGVRIESSRFRLASADP